MVQNTAQIVIAGNLVSAPEDRTGSNDRPFCIMRVASDRRWADSEGNWKTVDSLYIDVQVSGALATHCMQSLCKGAPVIIEGRLFTNKWTGTNDDGAQITRSSIKIRATHVGLDLNRVVVHEAIQLRSGTMVPLPIGKNKGVAGDTGTVPNGQDGGSSGSSGSFNSPNSSDSPDPSQLPGGDQVTGFEALENGTADQQAAEVWNNEETMAVAG